MVEGTERAGTGTRAVLTVAALVIVVGGLRAAEQIMGPFLLSVFIAIVAGPILYGLMRRGVPRWLALTIMIAAIVGSRGWTASRTA